MAKLSAPRAQANVFSFRCAGITEGAVFRRILNKRNQRVTERRLADPKPSQPLSACIAAAELYDSADGRSRR
jgi:hypothetical protein